MSDSADAAPLLNRAQLAQIFDVSENTIDKWRARGMPVEVEGGNGVAYGFDAVACREWYQLEKERAATEKRAADEFVAQQRMAFLGIEKGDKKAGLSPAQMRELAQAELVWMQAAQARGSLVPSDEVADLLDVIFSETRAALDGLPDWLEREFTLEAAQVERAVSYCDEILTTLGAAIEARALGPAVTSDPIGGGLI